MTFIYLSPSSAGWQASFGAASVATILAAACLPLLVATQKLSWQPGNPGLEPALKGPAWSGAVSIPMRLFTHNIRYAATSREPDELPWDERRPKVVNEIRIHTMQPEESFVCLQEVLHGQLLDILTDLNRRNTTDEWSYVGVGRDDGNTGGEYSPLFYRPGIWKVESFKTVWLSPTPSVPGSKGWGAGSVRIVTVAKFAHRKSGVSVVGMCTHLDDASSLSRLHSARIIIHLINRDSVFSTHTENELPVFLAGDFNSQVDQEAYQELSKPESPVSDLRLSIPTELRYGNTNTFTGFTNATADDSLIDFIWTGPRNASFWQTKSYGVLPNKFEDGVYSSDHRAVLSDTVLIMEQQS